MNKRELKRILAGSEFASKKVVKARGGDFKAVLIGNYDASLMTERYVEDNYVTDDVFNALKKELSEANRTIREYELAEKMQEPLKKWEVVYGDGWVETIEAHTREDNVFRLYDGTIVAVLNKIISTKLV